MMAINSHSFPPIFVMLLKGIGIDMEDLEAIPTDNINFMERNYTALELEQCKQKPNPQASFTGRWAAKEAVIKAISCFASSTGQSVETTKGAAAPLVEVEILNDHTGVPQVILHGFAKKASDELGIHHILVSISHTDRSAIAMAYAA
jgi:phosphopantetheine--protein transferase-like protein